MRRRFLTSFGMTVGWLFVEVVGGGEAAACQPYNQNP